MYKFCTPKMYALLRTVGPYYALSRNIWAEARGQGKRGMEAVATLTLNRAFFYLWGENHGVKSPWPPGDIVGVIAQYLQFSWTRSNDPSYKAAFRPWKHSLLNWREAKNAATQALLGEVDPLDGALFYLNPRACSQMGYGLPRWAMEFEKVRVIRDHHFYKPPYAKGFKGYLDYYPEIKDGLLSYLPVGAIPEDKPLITTPDVDRYSMFITQPPVTKEDKDIGIKEIILVTLKSIMTRVGIV